MLEDKKIHKIVPISLNASCYLIDLLIQYGFGYFMGYVLLILDDCHYWPVIDQYAANKVMCMRSILIYFILKKEYFKLVRVP